MFLSVVYTTESLLETLCAFGETEIKYHLLSGEEKHSDKTACMRVSNPSITDFTYNVLIGMRSTPAQWWADPSNSSETQKSG